MTHTEAPSRGIHWKRIVAEGAAIVLSILMAFAIDAWWDARGELEEERDHLLTLSEEFSTTLDMIGGEISELGRAREATRLLLSLDAPGAVEIGPDSLAEVLEEAIRPGRANLPSGALEALIQAGDLRLIRDQRLATRLAAWSSQVAEVYENTTWLIEQREGELVPFLRNYAGGLWTASRSGLLAGYPSSRFPPDIPGLFSDQRFEGLLATRAIRIEATLARYRALGDAATSILESIEEELR